MADYDPRQELNPAIIVTGAVVLVLVAFGTVGFILFGT